MRLCRSVSTSVGGIGGATRKSDHFPCDDPVQQTLIAKQPNGPPSVLSWPRLPGRLPRQEQAKSYVGLHAPSFLFVFEVHKEPSCQCRIHKCDIVEEAKSPLPCMQTGLSNQCSSRVPVTRLGPGTTKGSWSHSPLLHPTLLLKTLPRHPEHQTTRDGFPERPQQS